MSRINRVYGLRLIRAAVLGLLAAFTCIGLVLYFGSLPADQNQLESARGELATKLAEQTTARNAPWQQGERFLKEFAALTQINKSIDSLEAVITILENPFIPTKIRLEDARNKREVYRARRREIGDLERKTRAQIEESSSLSNSIDSVTYAIAFLESRSTSTPLIFWAKLAGILILFISLGVASRVLIFARADKDARVAIIGVSMLCAVIILAALFDTELENGFEPELSMSFLLAFMLPLLLASVPPYSVFMLERLRENPTFRRWFVYGRGGSARWAGPKTYDKHPARIEGLIKPNTSLQTDRIFLGRSLLDDDPRMPLVGIKDDAHMLTIGMTGSGKSTTVLFPNLAMYKGSAIVLDPKGELALQTYRRRSSEAWQQEHGVNTGKTQKHFPQGRCFVLDPFNETKGALPRSTLNPLLEIDIKSDRAREMIEAVSDGCIPDEGERNKHFRENAKLFFEGVLAHVLSKYPEEKHNLPFLLDLFIGIDKDGFADPDALKELIIQMRMNPACGRLPQHAAATLDGMGDREKGSVLSTLARSLKWAGDPAMRNHLISSDFSFRDIAVTDGVPDTVYIVLPFGLIESQMRWLRVLIGIVIVSLRNRENKPDPATLFILDEFPRLGGKIEAVENGIVTLRSAKVKLWPFIQSISQLERDYPNSWRVFTGSANVQIFGVTHGDNYTADWISTALGSTVNVEKRGRIFRKRVVRSTTDPLYTSSEVADELGKYANLQVILPASGFPMRLERLTYKPLRVGGEQFRSLPEWKGHFEDH